MVHPFEYLELKTYIKATLDICTLYKGVPHGIAVISYTDPKDNDLSFRGVGIFKHGELHNAPFTCIAGDGLGYSSSKMQNGRPADHSYYSKFSS